MDSCDTDTNDTYEDRIEKLGEEKQRLEQKNKELMNLLLGEWEVCLEEHKNVNKQQAERIKKIETSLKIAIGYIEHPGNRTLKGQLKDIETGHY